MPRPEKSNFNYPWLERLHDSIFKFPIPPGHEKYQQIEDTLAEAMQKLSDADELLGRHRPRTARQKMMDAQVTERLRKAAARQEFLKHHPHQPKKD